MRGDRCHGWTAKGKNLWWKIKFHEQKVQKEKDVAAAYCQRRLTDEQEMWNNTALFILVPKMDKKKKQQQRYHVLPI